MKTRSLRIIGRHKNICPLAYPPYRRQQTEQPELIIISNPNDMVDASADEALLLANHVEALKPILLLSEEPYWDLLFSPDPLASAITLPAAIVGCASVQQINHCNSELFDFDKIPHFPLTAPQFAMRYRRAFSRNASQSPKDWEKYHPPHFYGFVGSYRSAPHLGLSNGPLRGLCPERTEHAEKQTDALIYGSGWPQELDRTDWHRAKLKALDQKCSVINAIENTLAPQYLTEKPYDAYACGAIPLLYPRDDDLYARVGFEAGSYFLLGQESEINWEAYAKTQAQLAHRWHGPAATIERQNFAKRLDKILSNLS